MAASPAHSVLSTVEVRAELSRILTSTEFAASRQLSSFLQYVVEESLAGREDRLKERTLAVGALGRGADFDPRIDCIVRVVAGKLRRALERYYAVQGASNPLCIDVPRGGYCPVIRRLRSEAPRDRARPFGTNGRSHRADRSDSARPSVAVLPFFSLTGGPEERFFADLLAEDVVVRLSRLRGLEVIDDLAMRRPEAAIYQPGAMASRLRADFVVAGTVVRFGCRVRLTVRLIDVSNNVLVWADQFEREIGEGRPVQQKDVARRIVTGVCGVFGAVHETASRRPYPTSSAVRRRQ